MITASPFNIILFAKVIKNMKVLDDIFDGHQIFIQQLFFLLNNILRHPRKILQMHRTMLVLHDRHFCGALNPFNATGLFLYPLKTPENLWSPEVFRGMERDQRPLA